MLSVEGLGSAYGRIEALHGVDVAVNEGEIVSLVGGNGAGKTTLLRAISGVQPVTRGKVLFEGADITRLGPHRRVECGIAQVPEGRQIFGSLTIEDNLRLGAYRRNRGATTAFLEHVYESFPVLRERRQSLAAGLSGGQQQMLAIGRALMSDPKLLLLDEPSMGLAPILVDKIFEAITRLRDAGTTVFLVEQNAFAALNIADRGYVIETGDITLSGPAGDLMRDERVREAYLGV
ncbi:branched-chain amino acid transport system ATP-binding protein [Rhodobium orientis]|uniref:ABC transporter ATP-binding protein n=1 Tax=Rhodobium orientis TaxID=34017 RepID=A0A327JUI5_9HYPH|nr:ABC transporter ATP-binding protein [Rhodobium orientis]MBB4302590.1 branched-chain amino acid transport system ATP-binding protein [Rhodobium orientis]MBK5951540.1 ABC transporter ATP-binding protein [Rhodobium orientis]RAI29133.1 ABC transporter ATP-binding protein [Rhodobium orientis]